MALRCEDEAGLRARLRRIRLLALDVDGVLTDGTLLFDSAGGTLKRFHTADGLGLAALREGGIRIAWITGRADGAVAQRAEELGIPHLITGAQDKREALQALMKEVGAASDETAYIGDDWNDLPAFGVAGVRIAVASAEEEVKARADAVTLRAGGRGAVRDVCNALMEAQGGISSWLERYLKRLRERHLATNRAQ